MEKSTIVGHRKGLGLLGVQMCWGGRVVGYFFIVPQCAVISIQASLHKGTCFTMNIKGGVTVKATCCTILGA